MNGSIRINSESPVLLQYYVPFRFDDSRFSEISTVFDSVMQQNGTPIWEKSAFPVDNGTVFYDHVRSMMNIQENPHSVCRSWKFLPPEGNRYVYVDRRNKENPEEIPFTLCDIRIHLFRTGIGFLGYRIAFAGRCPREAGQLAGFQCRMKKLRSKDKNLFMLTGEPEQSRVQVRLGGQVMKLLPGDVFAQVRLFGEQGDFRVPAAALMFSYLCYDCPDREALKEITVHMAMGYDPDNTRSDETIQSCGELAKDVFYYVSQNGCAISVNPNERNRNFFVLHSPASKYHFMFLILLYQRCSLLNFSIRLFSDFPSEARSYLGNSDYADRMQDFMTDVDTFLMKNDIATVSYEPFHNMFYEASRKAMRIEEDKQSLRSGFESLASIQRSRQARDQEEQNQRDQEDQEKFSHTVEYLAIILGLIEILSEVVNFIQRVHLALTSPEKLETIDYVAMGLFLIVIIVVAWLITRIIRLRRSRTRRRK